MLPFRLSGFQFLNTSAEEWLDKKPQGMKVNMNSKLNEFDVYGLFENMVGSD